MNTDPLRNIMFRGHIVSSDRFLIWVLCNFFTLYLLCKIVAINVITVGVSPWTLDIYAMALQDCGFLEKEDGLLDLQGTKCLE